MTCIAIVCVIGGDGQGGCGGFLKMKWLPTFLVEGKINCDIL